MAFEHTPYGTIYLCDVKESNFGVKTLANGTVQVAATDMDISLFESVMKETVLAQAKWDKKNCSSKSDCDFIHCWSYCNHETSRCDNKLYSSNIQVSFYCTSSLDCYVCMYVHVHTCTCDILLVGFSFPAVNLKRELQFELLVEQNSHICKEYACTKVSPTHTCHLETACSTVGHLKVEQEYYMIN